MAATQFYATGRRKESTARVFLRPGNGAITVNRREFKNYFPTEALRVQVVQPLRADRIHRQVRRALHGRGGGVTGQAGAIRLGIARALCEVNAENRPRLKKEGLLTRDARAKERKKYGMAGARKRFQFSKR